jgi:hypothetical protein
MTGPGQYHHGPRAPERVSSRPMPSVPAQVESPAERSAVEEIVGMVFERMSTSSTTQMRKETRPIRISLYGIVGALLAAGGWAASEVGDWQEAQRNQWAIEAKQLEQDDAMAKHLGEPHVSPAQIEAIEARLLKIEGQLAQLLERDDKPVAPPKRGR